MAVPAAARVGWARDDGQEDAVSASAANKAEKAPVRTAAEIEADLASTRARLVGTINQIEDRLAPQNLMTRTQQTVRDFYVGPDGPRWDRVAYTVAAVGAGLLGVRIASRTVRWALAIPDPRSVPDVVYVPVPRDQLVSLTSKRPAA